MSVVIYRRRALALPHQQLIVQIGLKLSLKYMKEDGEKTREVGVGPTLWLPTRKLFTVKHSLQSKSTPVTGFISHSELEIHFVNVISGR